jgi:hypothetical protein
MRVSEIEFDDLTGELDFLVAVVGGSNGVVCIRRQTEYQSKGNGKNR